MTTPVFAVEMDFGTSDGWVDITADVRVDPGVRFWRGKKGNGPTDRVASTGSLIVYLDNSQGNSSGLLGLYSPNNANARTGFNVGTPVRVKETWDGTSYYNKFYITDIEPEPGKYRSRRTRVIAEDVIGKMSTQRARGLTTQSDKTSDELLTILLATLPVAPNNTSLSAGLDSYEIAFHDIKSEKMSVLGVVQRIVQSDLGYFFECHDTSDGETVAYQTRHDRLTSTSALTLDDTMSGLSVTRTANNIYNLIRATSYPGDIGSSDETIYTLQRELQIASNQTIEFEARYRDPAGAATRVAITDGTGIEPEADTDYKLSSGTSDGGNDLNAALIVVVTFYADYAAVSLTNTAATAGYLNLFKLRGNIIRLYDPSDSVAESSDSQDAYGVRELAFALPYQSNPNTAKDFSDHLEARWKNPVTVVESVSFYANRSDTLMQGAVELCIGDRITISETVTGISDDYSIVYVEKEYMHGARLRVTYGLERTTGAEFWFLGIAGLSELGQTTTLGF